jgi:hypothetical protein
MSRELLTSHNPQLSRPTKADNLGCIAISFISEVPDNVGTLIRDSLSVNTQRAYLSDIAHFEGWGGTVPTSPAVVASYLAGHHETLSVATLVRRIASISKAHEARGL